MDDLDKKEKKQIVGRDFINTFNEGATGFLRQANFTPSQSICLVPGPY